MGKTSLAVALGCALMGGSVAWGDDYPGNPHPYGLDPNFPLQVEDARTTPEGKIEYQQADVYQRSKDDKDQYTIEPQLKWGVIKDVDLHLTVPYVFGNGDTTDAGQVQVNSQWEFLEEKPDEWWPALAVEGDLNLPTGTSDDGWDVGLQVIATKTVISGPTQGQIHLNFTETRNGQAHSDQREFVYNAVIGYSQRILDETVLVLDVGRSQGFSHNDETNFAEVGLIQKVTEHLNLAVGVGLGFGDESYTYGGNFAFQYEF